MIFQLSRKTAVATTNRKILRAAIIVGSLGLLTKVAATLKEVIVARSFGRGDEVDAFLIAFVLPSLLLNVGMSSLGYALVPIYVEARHHEVESAHELLAKVILIGSMALVGLAALLGLFAPLYLPWLAHSFSAAKLELTREMLYLLLPWVVFSGIAALATATLNGTERFALPAIMPLVTSFLTICFVLMFARRWGVFTLVGGAVLGSLLESMFLLYLLRRDGLRFQHWRSGLDERVRSVFSQYAPVLAGGILMGSTTVVDQAMAAMLPSGNVAALGYANRLIGGLLSLAGLSLSTATLPYFSKMVAANDWAGCRHTLKRYSVLVLIVSVPFTLLVIAFSHPIIRFVYQHGAFTAADTQLVSWVQVCYAIQIPFFVWSMLFVRFITAIRHNKVLMYASAINLILDISLNLALMPSLHVAGIALSTSIVYIVSLIMVSAWSLRFLSQKQTSHFPLVQTETVP
jgi:putative peptidoglycan lipid II flippase